MEDPILKPVDLSEFFDLKTEEGKKQAERTERDNAALKALMSPPGALKLPPLLERRRHIVGIPDGAFKHACLYDRIMVWQIGFGDGQRYKGTSIWMPDQGKQREKESTERGIIVGAGLSALDAIRANGLDLGHVVLFTRIAPIRVRVDWIDGKDHQVLVMNAGDLVSSEDLAISLRMGLQATKAIEKSDETGVITTTHLHVDETGKTWTPELPWRSPEY